MWILNFLPDSFLVFLTHAITATGALGLIAGFVLGGIPLFSKYGLPVKIVSGILLAGGIYLEGGLSTEMEWRKRVAEMEDKVKVLEENSKKINTKVQTKVVERTKVIREKGKTQIEYINRLVEGKTVEIVKDMSAEERAVFELKQKELQDALKNCPVPRIIIEEHNKAAEKK